MASFRCYDNSDVIATLITANFHLYLIQLWWQFFQMFVYGDVVYAQTWQVLTLKNCIEALSYASTAYVVASYGPRFFSSVLQKFGQLARIFWANCLPPPLAENCPYAYVLGWWKHKDDPNVLFLKYEDLHKVMFSYNNNSITLSSVASLISYTPAGD